MNSKNSNRSVVGASKKEDTSVRASSTGQQYNPALYNTSGAVKVMYDHILKSSVYPQEIFSLGGSMALISLLIGNKYRTSDGIYCNLYTIAIGPTGCGKDAPRSSIKDVAIKFKLEKSIPDNLASAAGLEDYLGSLDDRTSLLLIDEFGKFLQQKNKGDDFGVTGILLKLYTSVNNSYMPRLKAGTQAMPLSNPFVSLYGTTTEEAMQSALSEADSESGWLGRFLFLKTDNSRPVYQGKIHNSIPYEIESWFEAVKKSSINHGVVDYSDAANVIITKYTTTNDSYLRSDTVHPIIRSATVRAVEMIKKLALISSISRSPANPIINADDIEWGIAVVEHSTNYVTTTLSSTIENGAAGSVESYQLKKCLDIIKRTRTFNETKFIMATNNGYMPRRLLLKKMNINTNTLEKLTNTLKDRGDITESSLKDNTHGINCDSAYYLTENTV